jgi:hypothetical protein
MSRRLKGIAVAFIVFVLIGAVLFLPVFPWSSRHRHSVHKLIARAEMKIASWRGSTPRLASISGGIGSPGVEIEVLDSRSGWASLSDKEGNFLLPSVMWYPGVSYDLVLQEEAFNVNHFTVTGPRGLAATGLIEVGALSLDRACEISTDELPGSNSISYIDYDSGNSRYYRKVFEEVTAGLNSDEEKLDALNRYVASKLDFEQGAGDFEAARKTLERGSRFCGCLSIALAAIAEAGNYRTRITDAVDGLVSAQGHAATEVFYQGEWHLYDPFLGECFKNKQGRVAGYRELRLDPGLIPAGLLERKRDFHDARLDWIPSVYASGLHHYYYFKRRSASCSLWWPFVKKDPRHSPATGCLLDLRPVANLEVRTPQGPDRYRYPHRPTPNS